MGRTQCSISFFRLITDHPHAGGENNAWDVDGIAQAGPSPRGWGELPAISTHGGCRRTIPTRVGRTAPSSSTPRRTPDHPHAGGENNQVDSLTFHQPGPSPRGWGEPHPRRHRASPDRTIPTRVGRTHGGKRHYRRPADHPHAGGENFVGAFIGCALSGPSPRGWGEHVPYLSGTIPIRTIPTRVGRTRPAKQKPGDRTDHPHAGGENDWLIKYGQCIYGPSPRGWGELH